MPFAILIDRSSSHPRRNPRRSNPNPVKCGPALGEIRLPSIFVEEWNGSRLLADRGSKSEHQRIPTTTRLHHRHRHWCIPPTHRSPKSSLWTECNFLPTHLTYLNYHECFTFTWQIGGFDCPAVLQNGTLESRLSISKDRILLNNRWSS